MHDWVVESPSFEEQLMNNRITYLNQKGINEVVELIKNKDKEIERLKESEEYHRKGYAELHKRIDKAIEYIENDDNYEEGYCDGRLMTYKDDLKPLLDILRGDIGE